MPVRLRDLAEARVGTATGNSTSCAAGRAGRSTPSGSIGSPPKSTGRCGRRRHVSAQTRLERPTIGAADEVRALDFMSDTLSDGRKIRLLTVLDVFPRECLTIRVDTRFTGDQVVKVLEELAAVRGRPGSLRIDNGPEFTGRSLDLWAYFNQVTLDFSEPATPTDNAFIESFNGRLRQECLNVHWFLCLEDARAKVEAWRRQYNPEHPHRYHEGRGTVRKADLSR
jgi:putative transposase